GAIGIQKDESQIVHVAVVLAVLEQFAVVLGTRSPLGIAGAACKLPHHAGQESAGPVRPQLAFVIPAAADGIDWKELGRAIDERSHLPLGELQNWQVLFGVCVGHVSEFCWRAMLAAINRAPPSYRDVVTRQ